MAKRTSIDREIEKAPPCPACGSRTVAVFVYGMPTAELAERATTKGDVIITGCLIEPGQPKWRCRACGHEYGKEGARP